MSDTARVAVIDSETSGLPEQGQAEGGIDEHVPGCRHFKETP